MSINKLVSIKQAVSEAPEHMGLDLTRDKPTFNLWATWAEKDIGSYYSYKRKQAVLTIKNCRAALPCDAAYLKAVVFGDHGCDCGELFENLLGGNMSWIPGGTTLFGAEVFTLVDPLGGYNFCSYGQRYEVQDNCIVFSSNMNGKTITVQYLGLEEDGDGFCMVSENHIPAIVEYIMWKFCVRSRFSPIKMDLSDIKMHQLEYYRLASDARALDAELTPSERAQCVAMIHDPFSGVGLDVSSGNDSYLGLTY